MDLPSASALGEGPEKRFAVTGTILILCISACKLLVHLDSGRHYGYFIDELGKPFCVLGWAWVITAVIIVKLSPRIYYLFPAFPVLLAGGSVMWESWLSRTKYQWLKLGYPALMVVFGIVFSPLAIPVLPPTMYVRFTKALHLEPPKIETHKLGP